jgi:RNA polymerase sigma factor (sigma-70 family)
MSMPADDTIDLLQRWHGGERLALDRLLERHLPALLEFVERNLKPELHALRRVHDAGDLVHNTAARVLSYLPRFVPEDGSQFQRLLRTFVRNEIRNLLRSPSTTRRAERDTSQGDSLVYLSASSHSSAYPDRAAEKAERAARARAVADMALQFLDDQDRRIVEMRMYEEQDWSVIARELDITLDAARMRHKRALARLLNYIRTIKDGRIEDLLESVGC